MGSHPVQPAPAPERRPRGQVSFVEEACQAAWDSDLNADESESDAFDDASSATSDQSDLALRGNPDEEMDVDEGSHVDESDSALLLTQLKPLTDPVEPSREQDLRSWN